MSKEILSHNIANTARILCYGLHYNTDYRELKLRQMTLRALELDDELSILTNTEREYLEATMNEPYNN